MNNSKKVTLIIISIIMVLAILIFLQLGSANTSTTPVGVLFIIVLIALTSWQITSRWQASRRLKRSGLLVQARITDIKSESRLVTQLGDRSSTIQRLHYEDFLYAQWQDPLTQQIYTFRIEIPDFYQFSIREEIPIKLNLHNPNEYRLQYSPDKHYAKKLCQNQIQLTQIIDRDIR